jgi:hypothetical protein
MNSTIPLLVHVRRHEGEWVTSLTSHKCQAPHFPDSNRYWPCKNVSMDHLGSDQSRSGAISPNERVCFGVYRYTMLYSYTLGPIHALYCVKLN